MEVDFNNVRRQLCLGYDKLVTRLNSGIVKDNQFAHAGYDDREVNIKGYVLVDAAEIEEVLNDLRMCIGTVASCYNKDDDTFQDVYEMVYPESGERRMVEFNPEPPQQEDEI